MLWTPAMTSGPSPCDGASRTHGSKREDGVPGGPRRSEEADRPLTTRKTPARMLAAKGVNDAPPKASGSLFGAVQGSLQNHNGKSVETIGEGMPARWRLRGA
jgi:hypothetical protein